MTNMYDWNHWYRPYSARCPTCGKCPTCGSGGYAWYPREVTYDWTVTSVNTAGSTFELRATDPSIKAATATVTHAECDHDHP